MSLRLLVVALMMLFAFIVSAQENTVSFDDFSFRLEPSLATHVNIRQFAGDPLEPEHPGGPEVAHTQFLLYDDFPVPTNFLAATAVIRVYRTADFAFYEDAPYSSPFVELQALQTLLTERPDLSQFMQATVGAEPLPLMPRLTGSQIIRVRAEYVETPALQGIRYVTVLRIDDSYPFLSSDFLYSFQGISLDGDYYVAMISYLSSELFPERAPVGHDHTILRQPEYLSQSIATLNEASPDDFTPSLDSLDALVQTFSFRE